MGKTVIFIIIACVLIVVWSACVMAARADEKLREIMDDKKEPEEKEEDMTKQRTCKRCGMPTGATYYKININAKCDRAGATTEQFSYNLSKTLAQANSPEDVYCRSCVDKIENYMKENGYRKDNERECDPDKTISRETTEEREMI